MALVDVPDRMPWGEAWRLTHVLAADPSSQVAVALGGWDHPVSREWLVLANLLDVFVSVNTARGRTPEKYPRPWDKRPKALGDGSTMTVEDWRAMRARLAAEDAAATV